MRDLADAAGRLVVDDLDTVPCCTMDESRAPDLEGARTGPPLLVNFRDLLEGSSDSSDFRFEVGFGLIVDGDFFGTSPLAVTGV